MNSNFHRVRWGLARNRAMDLLLVSKTNKFPLHLFDVIGKIPHLNIMTYDEMVFRLNSKHATPTPVNRNWVQNSLADGSQDAALVKMSNRKDALILYNNDTNENTVQRIRYSIAHEIGHFVLRHPFMTSISRTRANDNYDQYELEANVFAQALLIPYPSLNSELTLNEISQKYDVSKDAAKHAWNDFHNRPWARPNRYPSNFVFNPPRNYCVPEVPGPFLAPESYIFCEECFGLSVALRSDEKHYCAICGSRRIKTALSNNYFKFHEKYGEKIMKYKNFLIDDNSRLYTCIRCDNEELDSNICQVCGAYVVNRCSGSVV